MGWGVGAGGVQPPGLRGAERSREEGLAVSTNWSQLCFPSAPLEIRSQCSHPQIIPTPRPPRLYSHPTRPYTDTHAHQAHVPAGACAQARTRTRAGRPRTWGDRQVAAFSLRRQMRALLASAGQRWRGRACLHRWSLGLRGPSSSALGPRYRCRAACAAAPPKRFTPRKKWYVSFG